MPWYSDLVVEGVGLLTVRARKSLQLANQEAHRLGHAEIDVMHLLLGLAKDRFGVAADVLATVGIDRWVARRKLGVDRPPTSESNVPTPGRLPLTQSAMHILAASSEIAEGLGHRSIGTGHLLLSLISQDPLTKSIAQLDVPLEVIQSNLLSSLAQSNWEETESVAAYPKKYQAGDPPTSDAR